MGHVFIVSTSEAKSMQHSPLVTTWVDGFKTEPKLLESPHLLKNENGIAQTAALRALHCWSQPSLCSITQMAKKAVTDYGGDDDDDYDVMM